MGLLGTKQIQCRANKWTYVISSSFARSPRVFDVRIRVESGEPVEGVYEEKASKWLWPGKPATAQLTESMVFERGWFNTFYSVRVRPTADCVAEVD